MSRRHLHTSDAQPEEQGSFCDRDSQNHYDNVSGVEKENRVRDAEADGATVWQLDEPIIGKRDNPHSVDQRFNVFEAEEDNHGFFHNPAKHRPGR